MRALSGEQFAAYTHDQITAAERILTGHTDTGRGFCSCGRYRPCSVAESCARTRDHYAARLALLEQTVPLPQLRLTSPATATAAAPRPSSHAPRRRWRLVPLVFGGAR